ncbi:serine hydrolase domain-containing protein [Aurantiacibacter gangjinensis]|uniref:Uncharacterized protein n=1 Tax=Aurantiacibacter gangjinensis TaxID=502682 RepID=A0A0G9MN80_9SPHN|nr:serine hydrolase domain-containing protein [Aurantiacibacter gangjinensis]APE28247.1 Beta-lactamase class C and other penicillin binding proteins [Aurantiacibacter gangjinensis]KLE32140.1 hypothetical protein AAW01_12115 [Aurantiacibacter gangjinensis]
MFQDFSKPFDPALSRRDLIRRAALLGGGAAATALPFGNLAFAQSGFAASWPQTAAWVNEYVDDGHVANMVATLGWRQDAPQFHARGTHTFEGRDRVTPDSIYRIYSMTKPVTGIATMMLVEDGLITLETPLADILPAFANMQVQKQYDGAITADNLEPAERAITIRHLLTHTAGLGYNIVQSGPIQQAYVSEGLIPGQVSKLPAARAFFSGEVVPTMAEFADRLAELPLVSQPGRRWLYSVSCDLLGYVIEVVSGQPFTQFLQQRIFEPCGMTDTGWRVPRSDLDRLTANYFRMGGIPLPLDPPTMSIYADEPAWTFGGAGLVSTPRDYDRFLQMLAGHGLIEGTRVMEEATVRTATSNLFPDTLVSGGGFRTGTEEYGFGAAGMVGSGPIEGVFGWAGAAGTVGLVQMNLGLRMNLMTQYMPAESMPVQTDFPRIVLRDAMAAATT